MSGSGQEKKKMIQGQEKISEFCFWVRENSVTFWKKVRKIWNMLLSMNEYGKTSLH